MRNYYDVLGVERTATTKEIQTAYEEKQSFYRSDAFRGSSLERRENLKELSGAYNMVGDACERIKYDRILDQFEKRDEQRKQETENPAAEHPGGRYALWVAAGLLLFTMAVAFTGFFKMW